MTLPPLPCPFCNARPRLTVRPNNNEATEYFAAVACYCGGYSACAHKMATAPEADEAEASAIAAWNTRAALAAVPAQPVAWTHVDYLTAAEHARQNDYPFAISAQARGPTPTHDVPLYAAPQAVPVPAWQPIETAPKDRDVLVACSHGLYVARYCEHDIEWWHVDDNKHGPFPLRGSSPTHWQPLPAAPKEQP